ncbi:hypothetical protein BSL78_02572 [Apostichopus japonicus]|uniref:Uncharacterized protein n=1 Tax=Stichopus japonicus TaxID=307972 RepID=A0A2G8LJM9_STIJA|nr:hypothetical protein BSL78_02572 [Apostichopus japonicus]
MAVASMPNMVTSQGMTFQEPFHSMHDSQQLLHPQIPSTSIQQEPPYPMSPPVRNRLMELLKIPPVPPSRFNNNYHPQIKVEPVMESMESMGSCKMGVDPMTPTSVDVGHLLGFLPVNSTHMQPQPPPPPPPPGHPTADTDLSTYDGTHHVPRIATSVYPECSTGPSTS